MSDLIDRQAALDALIFDVSADRQNGKTLAVRYAEEVIKRIKALPSAQSEPEEFEWCHTCREYDQEKHCCHRWTKVIRKTVDEMKAAQPGWIPCSERLPGEDESFYVLCCDKYGEIMIGNVFECYDGETPYSAESEHEYMYDCVAWMPLPEPWKGGQDNG